MNYNLFGTDGIRNTVGKNPFSLAQLPRLGTAIALWAHIVHQKNTITCLIASDTRASSPFIKTALISSMLMHNIHCIDTGILPTPAVYSLLQNQNKIDFGIVISASHNPYHDNGIKIINAHTGKLTTLDEQMISSFFYKNNKKKKYTQFGSVKSYYKAAHHYQNNLLNFYPTLSLHEHRIVLDCAHGATYKVAPSIFNKLGAQTIVLHKKPNGTNINNKCGVLQVEQLQKAVIKHKAFMGFAFDGDGDRVIAINKNGEIKNGDDLLAILADHPRYHHQKTIVGTIMSNEGLSTHLLNTHKQLIRTPVGDKYISNYLQLHNLLLGGEQSGHIIMRDYLNTGDGIATALAILEAALISSNHDLISFTKYPQLLINIPVSIKKELNKSPYAEIITHYKNSVIDGRLEVRYSGTENLLRIMIEHKNENTAYILGNELANTLKKNYI